MAFTMLGSLICFGTTIGALGIASESASCYSHVPDAGKTTSCSSPPPGIAEADEGESLLASASKISRALERASSSLSMKLSVSLRKNSAWRIEHEKAQKAVNESNSILDQFIKAQENSNDACSSRLKESKRVLDGLLKDVKAVEEQYYSHQELLHTESENLNITHNAITAADETYESEVEECDKEKSDALSDIAMYKKELEELKQIANPSIRYEHSISVKLPEKGENYNAAAEKGLPPTGEPQSLLEQGAFSISSCNAFKAFAVHAKLSSAQDAKNLTCDEQREELQNVFTKTWIEVVNLLKDAKERYHDTTCSDSANAKHTAALVPLTSQREQAAARISHSTDSLSMLQPVLDMLKLRVDKLQKHIEETLVPECREANKVQSSLNTVRDLIISLEKCPGRNDFMLKIPTETVTEDEGPPSSEPSSVHVEIEEMKPINE